MGQDLVLGLQAIVEEVLEEKVNQDQVALAMLVQVAQDPVLDLQVMERKIKVALAMVPQP